jgi:D-alanyl-D-alanine carboxypeptidase/D-alanyl-D-alanine-endopeptidase (penicillin-binding protein 4)
VRIQALSAAVLLAATLAALPAQAGPTATKSPSKPAARWPSKPAGRTASKSAPAKGHAADAKATQGRSRVPDTIPEIPAGDHDHDRIERLQAALRELVHGTTLGRTRVGIRVMDASNGRLFFGRRGDVLMDPASNQKVLATTTALMRLGGDWRFRTELTGPLPNADGVVVGDVYLRGSGDPTVRSGDLDAMAAALARRGVRTIAGAVVADPRRVGADEPIVDEQGEEEAVATADESPGKLSPRVPLVVNHGLMLIRVRPGAEAGTTAEVTTTPADAAFVIHNNVRTKARGKPRVTVRMTVIGSRIQIDVDGYVSTARGGVLFRRRAPHQSLYAAALMRAALAGAGITVRDDSKVEPSPSPRPGHVLPLLALHESAPLGIMLRRINKDSDNDYAERVLEAAGAEVYGGAPTEEKGVRLLREVIGELGLPPGSYVPRNGSGLGHANRITADAMAALVRTLYLDPRVGPEILQSLSVGGVDGTTRNRFKGTLAAEHVRAKTGTLNGKSCLSGLVGDGQEVLAFSILVEGLRGRNLGAVRGAQVMCVNAMMRYVKDAHGLQPATDIEAPIAPDFESGGVAEGDEEIPAPAPAPGAPGLAHDDPVDAYLRKQREQSGAPAGSGKAPAPAKPLVPAVGAWH